MAKPVLRISVIVPTYDRPEQLMHCLAALAAQDLDPRNFEILVVDDGSPSPIAIGTSLARSGVSITLLRQKNAGPATARNVGAQQAAGEYLAFTDDDCRPAANWLRTLLAALESNPRRLVGGLTVNELSSNLYSESSQLLVQYLYEHYTDPDGIPLFLTSNNFALSRSLYWELGGFCSDCRWAAGEDREFCHRWREAGLPVAVSPQAVVYHAHAMTLSPFLRQHFTYGRAAYQFRRALLAKGQRPVKLERPSFYRRLLLYPWNRQDLSRRWAHTFLIALSQAANFAGFIVQSSKQGRWHGGQIVEYPSGSQVISSTATAAGVMSANSDPAKRLEVSQTKASEATTAPNT